MFIVRFVNTLINVSLGYFIEQYIVLMIIDYLGKKTYASFNSIWKSNVINVSSKLLVWQIWNKSYRCTSFEHKSDDQHIYSIEPNLWEALIGQNESTVYFWFMRIRINRENYLFKWQNSIVAVTENHVYFFSDDFLPIYQNYCLWTEFSKRSKIDELI
eukprot:468347_1